MKLLQGYVKFVLSGFTGFMLGVVLPSCFIGAVGVTIYAVATKDAPLVENRRVTVVDESDAGVLDNQSLADGQGGGGGEIVVCAGKPAQFNYGNPPDDVLYAVWGWYCGRDSESAGLYDWIGVRLTGLPVESLAVDLSDVTHPVGNNQAIAVRCLWLGKLASVYHAGYRADVNAPVHVKIEERDWQDAQFALNSDCSPK